MSEERQRVYMRAGHAAHLLPWSADPNYSVPAICGRLPFWTAWMGTGSQNEYEKAAALPLCLDCRRLTS